MSNETEGRFGRNCLRTAATLAAGAAMLGTVAGTASAHGTEPNGPEGDAVSAVQSSAGALVGHLEKYHLSDPTWEVTSLLTSPEENIRIHMGMTNDIVDPIITLLP